MNNILKMKLHSVGN